MKNITVDLSLVSGQLLAFYQGLVGVIEPCGRHPERLMICTNPVYHKIVASDCKGWLENVSTRRLGVVQ
jgi:hypothetical protein